MSYALQIINKANCYKPPSFYLDPDVNFIYKFIHSHDQRRIKGGLAVGIAPGPKGPRGVYLKNHKNVHKFHIKIKALRTFSLLITII